MTDPFNGKDPRQYCPCVANACRRAYRLSIDAIREAARAKGYAIGVHGSLARDIDLIAAPWSDWAAPADELAEAVRLAAEQATGAAFLAPHSAAEFPRPKPHGRLCWSFHLGGGPYIDLSVLPRSAP